jgi:Ca2+-binding RTX toxin-like protein
LSGNEGNDSLTSKGDSNVLSGNQGDDSLISGKGDSNVLSGNEGDDSLTSKGGSNVLSGNEGDDSLMSKSGSNVVLSGNQGDDLLKSGKGSFNVLSGNEGNDKIYSQGTNDVISGGNNGNDNDTIWLNGSKSNVGLLKGKGRDVINNFKLGSTTLFVKDVDNLSFTDSEKGTNIMEGKDLIAVANGVSSDVFTKNTDDIFEPFGSEIATNGDNTIVFENPSGTVTIS